MSAAGPPKAAERLVHHDVGVGQAEAFALCAHAVSGSDPIEAAAEARGGHVRSDVLHGVVDREAGAHDPAGQGLMYSRCPCCPGSPPPGTGAERRSDWPRCPRSGRSETMPLLQHARIDVVSPFAPTGLLDHHRDQLADRPAHRLLTPLLTAHSSGAGISPPRSRRSPPRSPPSRWPDPRPARPSVPRASPAARSRSPAAE